MNSNFLNNSVESSNKFLELPSKIGIIFESDEELFREMLFWRIKLQHSLNILQNNKHFKECLLTETNRKDLLINDGKSVFDNKNEATVKYHYYLTALEERERNKELLSQNQLENARTCIYCDNIIEKGEKDCEICGGMLEISYNEQNLSTKNIFKKDNSRSNEIKETIEADISNNDSSEYIEIISLSSLLNIDSPYYDESIKYITVEPTPEIDNNFKIISEEKEKNEEKGKNEEKELIKKCNEIDVNKNTNVNIFKENKKSVENKWICIKCTFLNSFKNFNCEICSSDAPHNDKPRENLQIIEDDRKANGKMKETFSTFNTNKINYSSKVFIKMGEIVKEKDIIYNRQDDEEIVEKLVENVEKTSHNNNNKNYYEKEKSLHTSVNKLERELAFFNQEKVVNEENKDEKMINDKKNAKIGFENISSCQEKNTTIIEDRWRCVKCGLFNSLASSDCETCGTGAPHKGKWRCETCTFINDVEAPKCAACDKINAKCKKDSEKHDARGTKTYWYRAQVAGNVKCRLNDEWEHKGIKDHFEDKDKIYNSQKVEKTTEKLVENFEKKPNYKNISNHEEEKSLHTLESRVNFINQKEIVKEENKEEKIKSVKKTVKMDLEKNTTFIEDRWRCVKCGLFNSLGCSDCETCGTGAPHKGKWRCETCTFINDIEAPKCAACDKINEGCKKYSKEHDARGTTSCWYCAQVTGHGTYCSNCGLQLQGSQQPGCLVYRRREHGMQHVWMCTRCRHLTDGMFKFCERCKNRRADRIKKICPQCGWVSSRSCWCCEKCDGFSFLC